jgi:hypothetical protein
MDSRILRCLDAIFYGFLALALVTVYEATRVISISGPPTLLAFLPLAGITIAVLLIPPASDPTQSLAKPLTRAKFTALLTLGLAPFISWQFRSEGSLYLAASGGLGILAAVWFLTELTGFLEQLFAGRQAKRQWALAKITGYFAKYMLLTPTVFLYFFITTQLFKHPSLSIHTLVYWLGDTLSIWSYIYLGLLIGLIIALLALIWQAHNCLNSNQEMRRRKNANTLK